VTTLVALLLTAGALAVILIPAFRRSRLHAAGSETTLDAWRERYRSSLADLQDAELDWQIGNLADGDYAVIREEQRLRAAEALREVTLRETIAAELRAAVIDQPTNGVVEHPDTAAAVLEPATTVPREARAVRNQAGLPRATPLIVGGAAALAAVAAVVVMYFRLMDAQAAQQPLATLPIDHAHTIALDAAGGLWVGHHGGALRSADGQAWRAAAVPGDVMALPTLDGRRFAFGHDVLYASDDAGGTWAPVAHDLPGMDIHGADVGAAGLYAYVVGFGVFRSVDGNQWQQLGPPLGEEVGGLAVLPGASGGDVLYINVAGAVGRSPDGGRTWGGASGAGNLALSGFVNALASDARSGLLYAGTSQGLFRSSSGGADWTRLPFRGGVSAVGVDGRRVAIVDDRGRFFLSSDGGGTWSGAR
jgi:hypothetical protein